MDSTKITEKVTQLKKAINGLHMSTIQAQDLIHELARMMNESGCGKTDEISIAIKEYLKEEISDGKITAKWIEECLPKEYKRRYTKSEVSSLPESTRVKIPANTSYLLQQFDDESKSFRRTDGSIKSEETGFSNQAQTAQESIHYDHEDLKVEKVDSIEELSPSAEFSENENVTQEFMVRKEKLEQIAEALRNCKENCYLTFNGSGLLISIIPDVWRTQMKR